MLDIKFEGDNIILKFPRNTITSRYFQDFLNRMRLEINAQKSEITDEEIFEISEEIKQNWWNENKNEFIKRISN
jgi:hypothetical protein